MAAHTSCASKRASAACPRWRSRRPSCWRGRGRPSPGQGRRRRARGPRSTSEWRPSDSTVRRLTRGGTALRGGLCPPCRGCPVRSAGTAGGVSHNKEAIAVLLRAAAAGWSKPRNESVFLLARFSGTRSGIRSPQGAERTCMPRPDSQPSPCRQARLCGGGSQGRRQRAARWCGGPRSRVAGRRSPVARGKGAPPGRETGGACYAGAGVGSPAGGAGGQGSASAAAPAASHSSTIVGPRRAGVRERRYRRGARRYRRGGRCVTAASHQ